MTPTRRLAAILAADVAGYSRLMGADEVGTLEALKSHRRSVVDPVITANNGRIVKTTGDGLLAEFASAVDAVNCAMTIQDQMAQRSTNGPEPRIELRIGINIGEIISEGEDIFGDGVNVAARVENECEPGGVYLSEDAYRQVAGKVKWTFEDVGERALKNIARPVRLYAGRRPIDPHRVTGAPVAKSLPLPDKPSIAVLPFDNLGGDPEQAYFADGMVEEIITALSRFRSLFVIARNSSFTYKGKAVDIRQVGRELGVRYVLEGSIRKVGGRVRITGQLIDALTGTHLWAEKFDGTLEDVFDLQDQVASSVAGAIVPALEKAEQVRAQRKPTENLNAYDYYMRALALGHQWTKPQEETLWLLNKAIELDPNFAEAYAFATWCYSLKSWTSSSGVRKREIAETERLARRAMELAKDDAFVLCWAGYSLSIVIGKVKEGAALAARAIELNPNLARAWN